MQDSITSAKGLVTQYNPLASAPGALVKADNCVIRRENIIEDRRGYSLYGAPTANIAQLMTYSSRVLAHNGTKVSYDNGSGTFADYSGTYSAPSGQKMRFVEANTNLYVTTDQGIQVFTDLSGTVARKAGAPRSLDPSYTLNAAATGFLPSGSQCAYRVVIQRVDANGNILIGYPSTRLWAANTAGTSKNLDITLYLPSEVAVSDVIQVYRTAQVTGTSSDSSGDEMALVYQLSPSSTDISNGYMTFTDSVVDALRGASLYTSPSQEGITQANERPPLAKDAALYRSNFMFYANTSTPERQFFSVVGASLGTTATASTTSGSTAVTLSAANSLIYVGMKVTGTGIAASTTVSAVSGTSVTLSLNATATNASVTLNFVTPYTIKVAGTTYSFADTEAAASGVVVVGLSGIVAADIDTTARSLVRVINRFATNTSVYAYYLSGPTDLPGQILIQERGVGASAFTIQVSNSAIANQFSASGYNAPVSPATSSQWTSSNQVQKNGLYYSKTQQLEAVPSLNYIPVGSANEAILRIIPLSDVLIIIKERSIYRLTGLDPNSFVVSPLDLTVVCKSADSVATLSNQVFMLGNQGVVSISANAVQVVSRAIEPNILPLLTYSNISTLATGCGYESERSYILSVMSNSSDTAQNQIYLYNIFTRTWVHWTFGFNAAIVEPTADKLYFSKPSAHSVYIERKNFDDTDYSDPETSISITSIDTVKNIVTFTMSGSAPQVGGVISQSGTDYSIVSISAIVGGFSAVLNGSVPSTWSAGAATYYPSVGLDIEWDAWRGGQGNDGMMKKLIEFAVLTDNIPGNNSATGLSPTFRTNLDEFREQVDISIAGGGWGGSWGQIPWGGSGNPYGYRTWAPRNKAYFALLNPGVKHLNARERLPIAGCSFLFDVISGRISR